MDPHASRPPPSKMSRRLDSAANVAMAERLQHAAEAAWAHAEAVIEDSVRRRAARTKPTPEAMERLEHTILRLEVARSRREMRDADLETARRLRAEEREAAEMERWIRAQAASMLADGWTPEELADIGIDARYTAEPPRPPEAAH